MKSSHIHKDPIQDLYSITEQIQREMNKGFTDIGKLFDSMNKKLDTFIAAQERVEKEQDTQMDLVKNRTTALETKTGIFAGGQLIVSIIAATMAYFFSIIQKSQ